MKKGLKTTLSVIAVLLVLAIIGCLILTSLYDFHKVRDHVYYAMDEKTGAVSVFSQGDLGDFFDQIGDNVYYAMDNRNGTVVIFGQGDVWDFDTFSFGGSFVLSPFIYGSVKKVIILDGVTNVSHYLFNNCPNLQEIYLPASIRTFDYFALCGDLRINALYFEGDCPEFVDKGEGVSEGDEPSNPLYYAWLKTPAAVYYQRGTTGWDPAFWDGCATLVEQEYEIDWSPIT